jgi:hypothetical protein
MSGNCGRCGEPVGDKPCKRPGCVAARDRVRARIRELRRIADEIEGDSNELEQHIPPADGEPER